MGDRANEQGAAPLGTASRPEAYNLESVARCQRFLLGLMQGRDVSVGVLLDDAVKAGWRQVDQPHDLRVACLQLAQHGLPVNHYPELWPFHLAFELTRGCPVLIGLAGGELWEGDPVLEAVSDAFGLTRLHGAVVPLTLEARASDHGEDHVLAWNPTTTTVVSRHALGDVIIAFAGVRCAMLATAYPAPPGTAGLERFPREMGHTPDVMGQPYEQFLRYQPHPARWPLAPPDDDDAGPAELSPETLAQVKQLLARLRRRLDLQGVARFDTTNLPAPVRNGAKEALEQLERQTTLAGTGGRFAAATLLLGLAGLRAMLWFTEGEEDELDRLLKGSDELGALENDPARILDELGTTTGEPARSDPAYILEHLDEVGPFGPNPFPGTPRQIYGIYIPDDPDAMPKTYQEALRSDPNLARFAQMSDEELDAHNRQMQSQMDYSRSMTRLNERIAQDRLRQYRHEQAELARQEAHHNEMMSIDSAQHAHRLAEWALQGDLVDRSGDFNQAVERSLEYHEKAEQLRDQAGDMEESEAL